MPPLDQRVPDRACAADVCISGLAVLVADCPEAPAAEASAEV